MPAAAAYKLRARMEATPLRPPVTQAVARRAPAPQRMREAGARERVSILWPQREPIRVSSPEEPAEREAQAVAKTVMQTSAGRVWPPGAVARAAHRTHRPHSVHRQAAGPPAVSADISREIETATIGGTPLPADVREFMEPRFRADFGEVRVHTDERAERLSAQLSARAFAYGRHIFFGRNQYRPNEPEGAELLAHELTHTIQQRAVVQRSEETTVERRAPSVVQRLGLSDILDGLAELAANVPGFTLLTLIIGRNPINMRVVERNLVNLLRAFMGLIPGGEVLFQVLERYGVVQRIAEWVDRQTAAMGISFQSIRDAFTRFTDSLGWSDIFSPRDVWRRAQEIFTPTLTRIRNFVSNLVTQAITWLKETFMEPISNFCREIPGYGIVKVMLGRDPFTNAVVPRTALNVVRAFAEFIPGGTEKVDQLVQSRSLERAYQWFITETQQRNLTWERISGTLAQAWNSLQLEDVLHPIDTLQRMIGLFRPLLTDLVGFARAALMKLAELIFEAAMGAGGARIVAIFKRARETFNVIISDPVGFLRNLLSAVGQGIRQFMNNILAHLRAGVIAWLTGPVARAGIQIPEQWDLKGIIWFVLQILGLTWPNIRQKLVRLMGERPVAMLEAGFQLLMDIREKGLVQALKDRVTEFFGQLRESALGAIKNFIQQRLVMAGIQQLLSLLSPVGAVIQAIIKIYNTVKFFIDKINEILDLVEAVVNSIAEIAAGRIGQAANFVERTMARTIPVILDFLARFIGLGNVGEQVQTTIRTIQARVDQMLDRAVDWIRTQAARLVGAVRGAVAGALEWWRKRSTFRVGRETHTLSFEGTEDNAELMVATTPRRLQQYVDDARQTRTTPGDVAALGRIQAQIQIVATARSELRRLRRANAAEAAMQPHSQALDAALTQIGTEIGGLMAGEDAGKRDHPIDLAWPKPAWDHYPPLYLYRSGSAWQLTARQHSSGPQYVKRYVPSGSHQNGDTSQAAPPSELNQLGIRGTFRMAVGALAGPLSNASTPGGASLNNLLDRYGWSASGENMDGDHVQEIQFGGVDTIENLWPLYAPVNRGAGSTLSRTTVQVGTERLTTDTLKQVRLSSADSTAGKFTFRITSVRNT
jgi:hypothetical protein